LHLPVEQGLGKAAPTYKAEPGQQPADQLARKHRSAWTAAIPWPQQQQAAEPARHNAAVEATQSMSPWSNDAPPFLLPCDLATFFLQVLHLKGNSDLATLPDLLSLNSLEKLYVDDVLAASLPAGLRKLTQWLAVQLFLSMPQESRTSVSAATVQTWSQQKEAYHNPLARPSYLAGNCCLLAIAWLAIQGLAAQDMRCLCRQGPELLMKQRCNSGELQQWRKIAQ